MIVFVTGGSGFVGRQLIRRIVADGHGVRALARSDAAAAEIAAAGGEPVDGDLDSPAALERGMAGAGTVVHSAAMLTAGPREVALMRAVNVTGTQNVIAAAQATGVSTLVHVSTEQVLLGDRPLVDADETWPYPAHPRGPYAETKGEAERLVLAAGGPALRAVAVRPRFVWGPGDNTVLPALVRAVRGGAFRWIDHGDYLTSTCHVGNVVEGIVAAVHSGASGQAYFLTDGEPVRFRDFVTSLLATQGVGAPTASVPRPIATLAAMAVEAGWWLTRQAGAPPLDRTALAVIGSTCTVDDRRARTELEYRPPVTVADGLAELTPV